MDADDDYRRWYDTKSGKETIIETASMVIRDSILASDKYYADRQFRYFNECSSVIRRKRK